MISVGPDTVGRKQLGEFLHFLSAQTIDDAALALVLLDEADDFTVDVMFGPDFVVEIRPVERRFEDRGIRHAEIFLNIHLHFGRGRGRERNQGRSPDFIDDRTDTPVLRTEIVAPLRDAVRLVDGIERNLDFAQKRHVVLFGQGLGCKVKQLGLAGQHVGTHLRDGRLVERRIEKMSDARIGRKHPHGVDLILHQRDQRRDDDRNPVHQQRRQLVAKRFPAARGHQHKGIATGQHIPDDRLLIAFERCETEVFLQFFMQQG